MSADSNKQLIQLSEVHPSSLQVSALISTSKAITSLSSFGGKSYLLDSQGRIRTMSRSQPLKVMKLSFKVSWIASSSRFCLFVSSEGQVYMKGNNSSFEGLPETLFSAGVKHLSFLSADFFAINASVSASHCAVVSRSGGVLAWGSNTYGELGKPENSPSFIPLPSKAVLALCGENSTCVSCADGRVFFFGTLPNAQCSPIQALKPFKHLRKGSEIGQCFVSFMVFCSDFIALLNREGEVFGFDICKELVKLSTHNHKIESLTFASGKLYGLCENAIYAWAIDKRAKIQGCKLSRMAASIYNLDAICPLNLFSLDKHLAVLCKGQTNLGDYVGITKKQHSCHKDYYNMLLGLLDTSKSLLNRPRHLVNRIDSFNRGRYLELLQYESPDYEIVEKRVQYEKRSKLLVAFLNVMNPCLKKSMEKMKEYGNLMWARKSIIVASSIANVLAKVYQRNILTSFSHAMLSIKQFSLFSHPTKSKDGAAKSIFYTIIGVHFRIVLHSFSVLKDLELHTLQRKASIQSIKDLAVHMTRKSLKKHTLKWKEFSIRANRKIGAVKKLTGAVNALIFQTGFVNVKRTGAANQHKQIKLTQIAQIFNREPRAFFQIYKKDDSNSSLHLQYQRKFRGNALIMSLVSIIKKKYRSGFYSISSLMETKSQLIRWKLGLLMLASSVSRPVYNAFNKWSRIIKIKSLDFTIISTLSRIMPKRTKRLFELFFSVIKQTKFKKVYSPVKKAGTVEMKAYQQRLIKNYAKMAKSASRALSGKPPWKPSSLSADIGENLSNTKASFKKESQKSLCQTQQISNKMNTLPLKFIRPK